MHSRNTLYNTYFKAVAGGLAAFPLYARKDVLRSQDKPCGDLKTYFDDLEFSLSSNRKAKNRNQPKEILTEITHYLQSQDNKILDDGYTCLLDRLTQIYTQGLDSKDNQAFAETAVNYADVIQLISQTHLSYDYSEVIGQLLHYMNLLYKNREKGWLHIYEHILKIPSSIKGIRYLKDHHLNHIQNWIEEGVDNIFELRDDQMQLYSEKIADLAVVEEQLEFKQREMYANRDPRVLPFTWLKDKAELVSLIDKRDLMILELENREMLVDLLEQNIQEFETILHTARRTYLIHPV